MQQCRNFSVCGVMLIRLACATTVFAQLDPLLFLKRVPPTVIIVLDTSFRMLEDGRANYYDPVTYRVGDDPAVAGALGVGRATTYRRIYEHLQFERIQSAGSKFEADTITAVPDSDPSFARFWDPTRLEIAKHGIAQAVTEQASRRLRWGLVTLRQDHPRWRTPEDGCDKPVRVTRSAVLATVRDQNPCHVTGNGRFGVYVPDVGRANFTIAATADAVLVAPAAGTAGTIARIVHRPVLDQAGIIPAGLSTRAFEDRPIANALADAREQAVAAMALDAPETLTCRNTVIVLVTGGQDDGDAAYTGTHDAVATAATFLAVSVGRVTRRVPIFVAAVSPPLGDVHALQRMATASGGSYHGVRDAAGVARVINLAVESGFARGPDFDRGATSEFLPVSPIVGSVNLDHARDADGRLLADTDVRIRGAEIPQRGNFLVTAGFALNSQRGIGFEGRLRAFRTFRAERDATTAAGVRFVADGTPLWPDVDGRPETANLARLPAEPSNRNIFTVTPGAGTIAFTLANAAVLGPHLGGADATTLIPFIRALALGAIVGSTPAVMDPPSLDPPPDADYGRADQPGTFAGDHQDRRSIIWVGGNDGMLHAVDARTGFEVWAFIPYNLLPKLQALMDGQSVEQFDYFVDSSPKLAEVKVNGVWRTKLIIGEGWGGTFYQSFDVTEAGMGGPAPTSDRVAGVLSTFAEAQRIRFDWAFPRYSAFDPGIVATLPVTDGTAGDQVRFFGDLKPSATPAEKSVGFTWSDPAVGPLNRDRSTNAVLVGSGYFPAVEDQLPGRRAGAPRAGRSFYVLDMADGMLLGGTSSCGASGSVGCVDVGDGSPTTRKNALQADPAATGGFGTALGINKAYLGDVDGTVWRFDVTETGAISFTRLVSTGQPIYGSVALGGHHDQFLFFATGSDRLPASADGATGRLHLFGLRDDFSAAGASMSFARPLMEVTHPAGTGQGGEADATLLTGERPSSAPTVAGNVVFFTTTLEDASTPCADFTSRLVGLTFQGGAAYDTTDTAAVPRTASPIMATVTGLATAPSVVGGHLVVGTSGGDGAKVEIFGDPDRFNIGGGHTGGVRLLSWRELR